MFYRRIDDHLSLRLASPLDAEELFDLVERNREHLAPWMPWIETTKTLDDEKKYLDFIGGQWAELKALGTSLILDGAIIGALGLPVINREAKWAEIGYWIDSQHEGKGFVTAAVRELERLCFLDLGMGRVQITNDVDNRRSRAIPERLGYTLEGVMRQQILSGSDRIVDRSVYSLLRPEWEARESV